MDRRIQIIKKVRTKTDTGSETSVDSPVATVWANRKSASSDKVLDDKVVALNVVTYQFRYHPDVAAENIQDLFVLDQGDQLEIYGREEIGRKDYFKIKCQSRE